MRRLGAAAVAVVVAGGLTACGGGTSDEKPRAAAPADCSAPDPGISADTIKVGAIYPSSGPNGELFKAIGAGIEARFAEENAKGGVGGRRLVVVPADDGDGEIANLNAARQLVVEEQVFGVIEGSTSSEGSGRFLLEEQIPVTGWGITPAWGAHRNMFGYRYSTSPKPEGEPVTRSAEFMKERGAHRVAIVAGGAIASVNVANQFAKTLPALDLEVGYKTVDVPLGATDFSLIVEEMRTADVDALYTGLSMPASAALYTAALEAGISLEVALFPTGYDSRVAAAYGDQLDGTYFAIDWRPFELPVPAHERFRSMLEATSPGEHPGQLAMIGWLSANLFVRGLEESDPTCPTRKAFIENLRMVDDYTADGLLPPTDFDQVFGKMPLCFWILQLQESAFVPISEEPRCGVLLKDFDG